MHNLSIKKNNNIASMFKINLSQDRHCKMLLTLVCMGQTLLVCTSPTTTREARKICKLKTNVHMT